MEKKLYTLVTDTKATVTELQVCNAYEIVTGKKITNITPEILNECKGLDAETNPITIDNVTMISNNTACKMAKNHQEQVQQRIIKEAQNFCDELSEKIEKAALMGKHGITITVKGLHEDIIKVVMQTIENHEFTISYLHDSNFIITW